VALVELARFPFVMNAEIAKGFLQSHEIGAVVFDSGMNIADSAAFAIPMRLMVLDEDYDEAHALLKDADLL
jgi:Putative prokaryotic signal transducing protein